MNGKPVITQLLAALLCGCLALSAYAGAGGGGGGGGGGRGGGGGGGGGIGAGGGVGAVAAGSAASVGYVPNGQIGAITYTVDPVNNTIVYTTDTNNNTKVMAALHALDNQPVPQVLIKVVFMEITYNNGLDVGVEGGLTHALNGSQNITYSNLFGLASQNITPSSAYTGGPGAALFTLTGDNFAVTARAISEKDTVKVLSRPTILARTGQPASIVIGQEVPLITGVNVSALGQLSTSISYTSVGIILNVTPYIHPNNDVEMILNPQISEVASGESTLISSGTNGNFTTPYINTRSANTVVITPNNQTVVIGGLMQDSKSVTDSKVPIVGDIPLLGMLFKHKITANAKTELVIFVTPTVVKTPSDLSRMSTDETSRTEMAPRAFPLSERDNYIDPDAPNAGSAPAAETAVSPRRMP